MTDTTDTKPVDEDQARSTVPEPTVEQTPDAHQGWQPPPPLSPIESGLRLAALVGVLIWVGFTSPWTLVVILALVLMIFLHELGHFLTARRAGMKVTEFFSGFGPRIWSFRRGAVEYGLKSIPAGAYVRIIGMTNLEPVRPEDEALTYRQKSFGQRLSVAVAGSTMHFLLALGLIFASLAVVGMPGGTLDPQGQEVWAVRAVSPGSGAEAAGLEPGDRVVSIGGEEIVSFEDLRRVSGANRGETVPLVFTRDGARTETEITLEPFLSWTVTGLSEDQASAAAERSNVPHSGDSVVAINGVPAEGAEELTAQLEALEGQTVTVDARRLAEDTTGTIDVSYQVPLDSLSLVGSEGLVGVTRDFPDNETRPAIEALVATPGEFVNITRLSVEALGRFFTPSGVSDFAGQVTSARSDSGATVDPTPAPGSATVAESNGGGTTGENRLLSIFGLVRIGSDVGSVDPGGLIVLFALVNVFIGLFNLVPLLPFDGGHVAIAVYEKIQEKRLNRRRYFTDVGRLMPLTYGVILLLGALFVSTLYLDIVNPL